MKKTAGQEFLEWYNNYVKEYGCSPIDFDVNYFWEYNNLEIEKQQIIDAYRDGRSDQQSEKPSRFYNRNAEFYYNETFKNK
jgi:hypothetical protein